MNFSLSTLGRTGLRVSALALGTVEIGLPYGIATPAHGGRPGEQEAIRLIHTALDAGINLIDTARDYGMSETILGQALHQRRTQAILATKVNLLPAAVQQLSSRQLKRQMLDTLDLSLRELQTDYVDVWQIHNVTEELLERAEEVADAFSAAQRAGKIRWTGGSFYGAALPLLALDRDLFDVMQVTYSVLDRRIEEQVLPRAQQQNVGIVVRSVLLKGVLTARADHLPARLHALTAASQRFRRIIAEAGLAASAAQVAVAFALAQPQISTVLVGMSSLAELEDNLRAATLQLPPAVLEQFDALELSDETLLNPSTWDIP
ncbi:MAG: aldo/keto reductase [Caldilineaceae bacterium]|nr:aldo/keto reductase [Caldilineaceae bacterium]